MTKRLQGIYNQRAADGKQPCGVARYKDGFDKVNIHPTAWQIVEDWKKPAMVFLNSMSDTFHPDVPWWYIEWMFKMMNVYKQHTWQVLTKRLERLRALCAHGGYRLKFTPNIWMGVSVENQNYMNRINDLASVDAKVKFVSFEPLLGPIDLSDVMEHTALVQLTCTLGKEMGIVQSVSSSLPFHWAIIGCETGPGARPMKEEWVRDLIAQCISAGVKVFYKQQIIDGKKVSCPEIDGRQWMEYPGDEK
jgi:protein gp37